MKLSIIFAAPIALALTLAGCHDSKTPWNVVTGILTLEQIACVVVQAELGTSEPAPIAAVCEIPPGEIQAIIDVLRAQTNAKAKAMKAKAAQCAKDKARK